MYQGTRYYIQRPTGYMADGEPEWVDMEFEPGKIWRSGRFTSAANQVNDWRDAGNQGPLRIVKRTFHEDVCGTYDPGQLVKFWGDDSDNLVDALGQTGDDLDADLDELQAQPFDPPDYLED